MSNKVLNEGLLQKPIKFFMSTFADEATSFFENPQIITWVQILTRQREGRRGFHLNGNPVPLSEFVEGISRLWESTMKYLRKQIGRSQGG